MSGAINKLFERTYGLLATEINQYIGLGGMETLKRVTEMSEEEVFSELEASSLLGRGGAGFPVYKKWQGFCAHKGEDKYIICNADESEPGTFKDRMFLTHRPYTVLEGMLIAAWVSKAAHGVLYVRGEYRMLQDTLRDVLSIAEKAGYLGDNIMGISGFNFHVTLSTGAGAYVCGEDSALVNSIEGRAGHPRVKPPFPTDLGLYGRPTLVNNVETFAQVHMLFSEGAEKFKELGTPTDGGTRLVCISGHAKNRGLFEVTGGTTLKHILYDEDLAGGTSTLRAIKFFHTGGQTSPIAFPEQFDTVYNFDTMRAAGLSLGSGALSVMDDSVCLVDYCKHVLKFLVDESCGKCTPCRIGTLRLYELLLSLTEGKGQEGDLERIEDIARHTAALSACGLGQAADRAILSALKYRRDEFQAHINGTCPTECCSMNGGENYGRE